MYGVIYLAKGKPNTVTVATELAKNLIEQMGLILWDVRFEKEGSLWFLRYFIDKDGGVTIDDCENFSRAVSKLLDETDPIDQSYYLEVSSPGIDRHLVKPWHFEQYIGKLVEVRFIRPVEGVRDFVGKLLSSDTENVCIALDDETKMDFSLKETAFVRLYIDQLDEIDDGGNS